MYRARDTSLKRDVALKVVPETFGSDSERLARFQREAEVLASLNHPNIAAIYGLQNADGVTALVMELVEGEDLADRIAHGPIPVDEALPIAKQIADALEAAHEHGIIHRDLKPANIRLREDGRVKVLDFGLAKALEPVSSSAGDAAVSPTITSPEMTQIGLILGTAAYMSPEQAKGHTADKRADVWAFGAVLYEMLTSRRAFAGEGVSETLANVMRVEPSWEPLPPEFPPSVVAVLRHCLVKDPRKRLRDIGDVRLALDGAFDVTVSAAATVPPRRRAGAMMLVVLILAIGVGGFALSRRQSGSDADPVRFSYLLPRGQTFRSTDRRHIAISPDGHLFAYNAAGGLFVRKMNEEEAAGPIPGTEVDLTEPMFSPDGTSLAYFQGGQLKKVSIERAGAPVPLCSTGPWVYGASWNADNTIVWSQGDSIWRVSGDGGAPKRIIDAAQDEQLLHPQLLPGGDWLLVTSSRAGRYATVARSLKSAEQKVVIDGAVDARYVESTGHLLYRLAEGGLFASAFDVRRLLPTAGAQSVLPALGRTPVTRGANYALASNGSLVYVAGSGATGQLVWVDRAGKKVGEIGVSGAGLSHPALSSDNAYIAYSVLQGGNREVVRYDFATTSTNTLSTSSADDDRPVWSPSDDRVLFNTLGTGNRAIVDRSADGAGGVDMLVAGPQKWTGDWKRFGGREYLLLDGGTGKEQGLWYQQRNANGGPWEPPVRFHAGPYVAPQFCPNGPYIAYVLYSSDPGARFIEVVSFPDAERKWTISKPGASRLRWSRDGTELFYVAGESLMRVTVSTNGPDLAPKQPQQVFTWPGLTAGAWDNASFDVSRDGRRFVVIESSSEQVPTIHVVLNWFSELKRLVPVR